MSQAPNSVSLCWNAGPEFNAGPADTHPIIHLTHCQAPPTLR